MNNIQFSKKFLFPSLIGVSLTNVAIAFFLIYTIFGQVFSKNTITQPPIVAEAVKQNDSPLQISILNIDNSNIDYQIINFTITNISDKAVQGYVIWTGPDGLGKTITNFFPIKSFDIGNTSSTELVIERGNIKPNENVNLSVDYVQFSDGSIWGNDTQKQSEHLAGMREGAKEAAESLGSLIGNSRTPAMEEILNKRLIDVVAPTPENFNDKNEKWLNGFRSGYKSIIGFVRNRRQAGDTDLVEKLSQIKKNLQRTSGEKL